MEVGKETSHRIKRGERKKELIEEVSKFDTHQKIHLWASIYGYIIKDNLCQGYSDSMTMNTM